MKLIIERKKKEPLVDRSCWFSVPSRRVSRHGFEKKPTNIKLRLEKTVAAAGAKRELVRDVHSFPNDAASCQNLLNVTRRGR